MVDKMGKVSERATAIKYAIRDLVVAANEVKKGGKEIIHLNIGDPLQYDFETPEYFKRYLVEAVVEKNINSYAPSEGLPMLREAIAWREKEYWGVNVDPENIIVTTGVSEAVQMLAFSFGAGNILLPGPGYPSYSGYFTLTGHEIREYPLLSDENWIPDVDAIARLSDKDTLAVVLINPNNPTGGVAPPSVVEEIGEIAQEKDFLIVSDEIYDLITFDNAQMISTQKVVGTDAPIITFNGISKTMLATGWRLGWMIASDGVIRHSEYKRVWEAIQKESRVRLSANAPVQYATAKALYEKYPHIEEFNKKLKERRDFFVKRLNELEQIECSPPPGAFYVFPKIVDERYKDDQKFVLELLRETGVLFVFGSGFGKYGKSHFRSVLLPPIDQLEKTIELVENFFANN